MSIPIHADARTSDRVASLNKDGTLKWFIPPYVIPVAVLLLVAARALSLS
jgi:hypothetical protein